MKRFLAIGECMVEMAPENDGRYRMGFAGDTFNTAWYMRRLAPPEVAVAYLSAVGDDTVSARMTAFMRDAGIVPELSVLPRSTVGLYMIALTDGERSFSYWRSTSAARRLAESLDDLPDMAPGDMAYFSGITVAILPEADRDRLFATLDRARAAGVTVAFDPNLRPALWPGAETMCRWTMEAARRADIVLPSYEDEAKFFGDAGVAATAARYASADVPLSIVKNGAEPLLIRQDGGDTVVAPEPAAKVVDTTAAGDSFNAGFFAGLARGLAPEEAAREGCRIAARVIGARGALVEV